MQKGAEAVHAANPDVLVILSGLNFDKDLSFLRREPPSLTFSGKLVFEIHRYSFTDTKSWETKQPQSSLRTTELDFDWALWTLVWKLLFEKELLDSMSSMGFWTGIGVKSETQASCKGSLPSISFQGPGYNESRSHKVIFHPMTGLCVRKISLLQPLELGPCSEADGWDLSNQNTDIEILLLPASR
ncbi:hypothetical protein HAX54_038961 [Datura stramonium]|uniref:Uncharacterized protein n=1 Tax=Datura stramonium TaxID=4076 RepID=A0ABS8VL81_DATST|nr:hypothetical protein [Datura stramonium]